MVELAYIQNWRETQAPWLQSYQVEQDLIISRVLVALFKEEYLSEHLAFRGGTALHKLFLHPAPRYSEDIDLVQIKAGPIKPIMKRIDDVIDFFKEPRNTDQRGHGIKALYKFESELEKIKYRLKLEINCKEHGSVFPFVSIPFEIKSGWFTGACSIQTYDIHELLGTKLRALYQRKKGRDLFDLDYARRRIDLDIDKIIHSYKIYIQTATGKEPPSQKEFKNNLELKLKDFSFKGDMEGILHPGVHYDQKKAHIWLTEEVISRM